jgi:nucleoside-diphosphate-sugar epimerase
VRSIFAERALIVRAGLIVGPYDWTNRFGWWVQRVARGGDLLVPDVGDRWFIQIVHGRDLAEWILDMAERGAGGTFNATSVPLPMEGVLAAAASVAGVERSFRCGLLREGIPVSAGSSQSRLLGGTRPAWCIVRSPRRSLRRSPGKAKSSKRTWTDCSCPRP